MPRTLEQDLELVHSALWVGLEGAFEDGGLGDDETEITEVEQPDPRPDHILVKIGERVLLVKVTDVSDEYR